MGTEAKEWEQRVEDVKQAINPTLQKLKNFLQHDTPVNIRNKEYQSLYSCVNRIQNIRSSNSQSDDSKNDRSQKEAQDQIVKWYIEQQQQYLQDDFAKRLEDLQGEEFLEELISQWEKYKIFMHWMYMIFKNFHQLVFSINKKSLKGESFLLLREQIFTYNQRKIVETLLNFIDEQRRRNLVPREMIQKTIFYFVELGYAQRVELEKDNNSNAFVYRLSEASQGNNKMQSRESLQRELYSYYQSAFEQHLIIRAHQYYQQKAVEWLQLLAPEYVHHALEAIKHEHEIADYYFQKSKAVYIEAIDIELVRNSAEQFLSKDGSGLVHMLQNDQLQNIDRAFTLLKRKKETYSVLADKISSYVKVQGQQYNSDERLQKDALLYIQAVIEFKIKVDNVIQNHLDDDLKFQRARDTAFLIFLNAFDNAARYLAQYADNELRNRLKNASDEESQRSLRNIMKVFKYLNAKDLFLLHYQKLLAKRLLQNSSVSSQLEDTMITLIKAEVGEGSVLRLSSMCKDMQMSKHEIMPKFQQFYRERRPREYEVDFQIQLITKSFWHFQDSEDCKRMQPLAHFRTPQMPIELKIGSDLFEEFYLKQYPKGRHLTWLMGEGQSEVIAYLGASDKKYQLIVRNLQLLLLLRFNVAQDNTIVYKQLRDVFATLMSEQELKINLFALLRPKGKGAALNEGILRREKQPLEDFREDEKISVNDSFHCATIRVNCIPAADLIKKLQIQRKSSQHEEDLADTEALSMLRQASLDGTIMRIMKSRRKEKFRTLLEEVVKQQRLFTPLAKHVKDRILCLVDREYLKRDQQDAELFHYSF